MRQSPASPPDKGTEYGHHELKFNFDSPHKFGIPEIMRLELLQQKIKKHEQQGTQTMVTESSGEMSHNVNKRHLKRKIINSELETRKFMDFLQQ